MKQRKKKYRLKKKWADVLFAIRMWTTIIIIQIMVTLAMYLIFVGY